MIIVIGRGHSGTRIIAKTLYESGVFMGNRLNESYDLVPASPMYAACLVHAQGGDARFLVQQYVRSVLQHEEPRGWKLPENTLVYPLLSRMFPEAYFIYWVRHPVGNVSGPHLTDNLARFGVPGLWSANEMERRLESWVYQATLVESTPRPERFLRIRLEDFVLEQDKVLEEIGEFVGLKLTKISVRRDALCKEQVPEKARYYASLYGY